MKRLLQVCFIAAMVFGLASCNKEDDNANSGGNGGIETPTSLVGTTWGYNDGEAEVRVMFETTIVKVSVQTPHAPEYYEGTYTYSNGSGTIALVVSDTMNITFTVSGNKMTAYGTPAGDVVLTLISSNPQPGPQPGGDVINSLVGTEWTWDNGSIRFTTATDAIITVNDYNPHKGDIPATYTYANGSGVLEMDIRGHNDSVEHYSIRFTVNGNKMTAYNTPDGNVELTQVNNVPPSGNYPLNGTEWQCTEADSSCYETYQIAFGTTNCHLVINSTCHGTEETDGTYVYNGTVTSGQGSITLGRRQCTFVVNGQTATVTAEGRSMSFSRTKK